MNKTPFTGLPVIGLVGGIGSGKSAVARRLAARQQFVIVDADRLGHQVLQEANVKKLIEYRFGKSVFDDKGEVNRSRLAKFVFGSDKSCQQARQDLNAIVHPKIHQTIQEEIRKANQLAQQQPGTIRGVILDAAILLETGWNDVCDAIAFVDASDEVRQQRVQDTRGWEIADWQKREESQLSLEEKRKASDVILDNGTSLETAVGQLEVYLQNRFPPLPV